MGPDDIAHRFAFHPALDAEKRDAHTSVRQGCRYLADFLNEVLPEGREKSVAVTKLEEVMFWGNAALARDRDLQAAAAGPADDPADTECGRTVVQAGGETQHHDIPDDGAPHAPTTECGCSPQRVMVGGHVVYEHADQDADPEE
jgi:hypothetical protein